MEKIWLRGIRREGNQLGEELWQSILVGKIDVFSPICTVFFGGKKYNFQRGGEENDLMGKKYTPARPRLAKIK